MAPRLKDQRDLYRCKTIEEVREAWFDFASRISIELVPDDRAVVAYANHGRWVADCPECGGGISCWDQNPAGACLDCGHVYTVEFPADAAEAELVLLARPKVYTRNWSSEQQDVEALSRENDLMGVHAVKPGRRLGQVDARLKGDR